MKVICYQHRGEPCDCLKPPGYRPAGHLVPRRTAMEVYYAAQAFSENLAYSPEAIFKFAESYLTLANLMARSDVTAEEVDEIEDMLREAGFNVE